jgi:iron complex outermembrane recepter protein
VRKTGPFKPPSYKLWGACATALAVVFGATAATPAGSAAWADEGPRQGARRFDIPAQRLPAALLQFARQANVELVMPVTPLDQALSASVAGVYTPDEALERLMRGAGFSAQLVNGVVQVRPAEAQGSSDGKREPRHVARPETSDVVVVVGTQLAGHYPASVGIDRYSGDEIARTSPGTVRSEQFVDVLTQNLATRSQYGPGAAIAPNREGVNGIDLRGLGVGTSLVLLNGRRLPLASQGQTVDVSLIPLSAIGRIEVLTDGASAIYGADAVGGVVNFVLRSGLDGSETRIDYGGVTDGGMREGGISHSFGRVWDDGEVFLSASASRASALKRDERDFARAAGRGDLSPTDERYALVGAWSLDPTPRLTLAGEVLASRRDVKTEYEVVEFSAFVRNRAKIDSHFINANANYEVNHALNVAANISYATRDDDVRLAATAPAPAGGQDARDVDTGYTSFDASAQLDGRMFRLPGGDLRFLLGLGRNEERYTAQASGQDAERASTHVFAEAVAPLIGKENARPFLHRLELSLAARYTDYTDAVGFAHDFGDRISPKIGLMWAPADWLHVRGSYAESFRAPSLADLDPFFNRNTLLLTPLNGASALVLSATGSSAHLDPEVAITRTLGFDVEVPNDPRLRFRATYFDIDYSGRIAKPDQTDGALVRAAPDRFPGIFYATNSAGLVSDILSSTQNVFNLSGVDLSDPTAAAQLAAMPNFYIFDNRLRNLSDVRLTGVDLDIAYGADTPWGDFSLGGRATFMADYEEQVTPGAPLATIVDTALHPVDLRARAFIGLGGDAAEGTLAVNYVDSYRNPYSQGATRIDSWTTWDARVAFDLSRVNLGVGSELSMGVKNIFDEAPPYVETSGPQGAALRAQVGFDPANSNPLGRSFWIELVKRW